MEPPKNLIAKTFAALFAEGRLLDETTWRQRLDWSQQTLIEALAAHRVFYVEFQGVRGYPSFYLDPVYEPEKLEAVSKALGGASGGFKWLFFTQPKGSLALASTGISRTPLEALAAGDVERVMRSAMGRVELRDPAALNDAAARR